MVEMLGRRDTGTAPGTGRGEPGLACERHPEGLNLRPLPCEGDFCSERVTKLAQTMCILQQGGRVRHGSHTKAIRAAPFLDEEPG